jgi:hypothetical protein
MNIDDCSGEIELNQTHLEGVTLETNNRIKAAGRECQESAGGGSASARDSVFNLEIARGLCARSFLSAEPLRLAANGRNRAADALTPLIHKITGRTRKVARALLQVAPSLFPAHWSEKDSQSNANSQTCQKGLHMYAPVFGH